MAETETQLSDAMTLLKHMWAAELRVRPFSEPRLRAVMHDTLGLAIKAGLHFDKEDFTKLYENFHLGAGYVATGYLSPNEQFYSVAVAVNNISACQSFEKALNRKPFITNFVDPAPVHYAGHHDGTRPRSRLSCGCKFSWKGEQVTVTSFAKDSEYLTACSYHPHDFSKKPWEQNRKPLHVYRINHGDLKG